MNLLRLRAFGGTEIEGMLDKKLLHVFVGDPAHVPGGSVISMINKWMERA